MTKSLVKTLIQTLMPVAALFHVIHAQALLLPGTVAPDFTADAALAGKPFTYTLSEELKRGPVVLWFYPKSFSSGCTVQAHMFADAVKDFAELGATVIGISNDDIKTQAEFSVKECSNTLPIAADPDGKIIKAYDASLLFGSETSKRVTYVITPDGKVFHIYSDMNPKEHVTESLDAVKHWKEERVLKEEQHLKEKQQPAN